MQEEIDADSSSSLIHASTNSDNRTLKLHLDLDHMGTLVDSWIDATMERKLEQLHLIFQRNSTYVYYPLPPNIFAAARTVKYLHLEHCRLEIPGDINISMLRKLYLHSTRLCHDEEGAVQKLISSCPLLEDLTLSCCSPMGVLRVSGLVNLQRLVVSSCFDLERIEIDDAPSLQYLEMALAGPSNNSDNLIFISSSCESLRTLILSGLHLTTADWFQTLLSRLPNLERLGINESKMPWTKISHHQLKRLNLTEYISKLTLDIDTPNLQSLIYKGHIMPLISILPSLNTSLQEIKISLVDSTPFSILGSKEFFEMIKHCPDVKVHLMFTSRRELILPKELPPILSPHVYDINHLNIRANKCSGYHQSIVDRMLSIIHPQTLSITRSTDTMFLKVLYNRLRNKEEQIKSCTTTKCWQHYLEEFHISGRKSGVEIDRIMAMPELTLARTSTMNVVTFLLKWRSLPVTSE